MSWLQSLAFAPGLLDLALKSAAVMVLALVAVVLLRRASAAWRHLVWCLGVASLLLLPALALALPAWRVSWLPQWAAERVPLAVTSETTPAPVDQFEPRVDQPRAEIDTPPLAVTATTVSQTSLPAAAFVTTGLARDPLSWPAIAWALGGLLSLVPLVVGLWQLAALHRRSRVIDQPCWLNLVDELRRLLYVRRTVQLRRSATAVLPFTWGVLPPVLLLPAEADGWSAERRRLVLLHELAHVRRWDWLTQLVAHVACAMYWFNPLVWLAARQMRIERERASDDLVLACGVRASDFAQELLTLAAGLTEVRLSTLVAVPMARRGALEDRLRGILDSRRSRAAITTAAVCLGAVIAAAAAAPLAMLRAAPPDPPHSKSEDAKPSDDQPPAGEPAAEKPVAAKPTQRDPTPEEIAARANGIRISVLNAKGDRGIPEFRVLAGVSAGAVSGEFEKRTGQAVINWQPHTCRIGKEGDYVWPLAKAYDEMALRVEADGYQPQVATGIKKAKGRQHVVFLLAEDKGVSGRVLTPDGKPATGATVALALAQKEIVWEGGKLRGEDQPLPEKPGDRWRRPLIVKTDAAGSFRLPTEIEPAAVLVIHESGVMEMAYDAWQKSPLVKLQAWGNIAGQVLWQDKPGADEEVTLSVHRDEYGYPGMIASYETTRTGKDGKFTFDRVLPGLVQISRPITPAAPNTTGISAVILNGMFQHVRVVAGDATSVVLGGQGRRVTGKFVGLDSWEGATYHFHPEAPHIGFGGDDASWKAFGQLKASAIGPLLFRDKQPINKDGTFTIENMLPGRYQIFLSAPGFTRYAASTQVVVDPEVPGQKPAPLDLKEIATVNKPAEAAPGPVDKPAEKPADEKPAEQPTDKTVAFRGKVVDSVTGKPIEKFVVQAGRFDRADPKNVTWGYKEDHVSGPDGSFLTSIRWGEGWVQTGPTDASKGYSSTINLASNWTARILAVGYYPQPLYSSAPPAEKDKKDVTVRLTRVPDKVRGVVLDHTGKPLQGAAVYALGVEGLNLAAGKSWGDPLSGHKRDHAPPVHTDDQGRFEIATGDATRLAVSHERLDAWPAAIPASGDVTIRLPEPARVEIELAIDGADKEIGIIYQFLPHLTPRFQGLQSSRVVTIANPGKLVLDTLPPGKYQFWRGSIRMLDRHLFDLKPGETKAINCVREKGARVRGKVIFPADVKLMSTVVTVLDQTASTVYSSQHPADDGTFLTERIPPGTQHLQAYAYKELTPQEMVLSGPIPPSFRAQVMIEVPAEGELKVEGLELKFIERGK